MIEKQPHNRGRCTVLLTVKYPKSLMDRCGFGHLCSEHFTRWTLWRHHFQPFLLRAASLFRRFLSCSHLKGTWIQENPLHTLASEMRDLLFSQYFQQSCCLVIQSQQIVLSFFPDRKHFPVFLPENLIMEHLIPLGYPAPCAVFVS